MNDGWMDGWMEQRALLLLLLLTIGSLEHVVVVVVKRAAELVSCSRVTTDRLSSVSAPLINEKQSADTM